MLFSTSKFFIVALASLTLSVAAQTNSTDPATCSFECGKQAGEQHMSAAQGCAQTDSFSQATQCLCKSQELLGAVETCMQSTCPDAKAELDRECSALAKGGAGSGMKIGSAGSWVIRSGALIAGMVVL
ncbi:hypothetical protein EXIGLDRAFT_832991 [Exidia glandulosa HHB12029]|uniref:Extracellular membrane protein CFEM domain-containing protein n=1 Tax=Exidia glandulosa HHB12029 TaxID=1314781 RepID=A0A165L357_EXIGL|nr:hypothetical protein EXIGLDRAFT_832991 [Exidia glandulosa HHB12029]